MLNTITTTTAAIAIATTILTACGGGSTPSNTPSSSDSARDTSNNPRPYIASTIVNTPPASYTYPASSEEEAAVNLLNAERAHCGFGYLEQDTRIDAAVRAHIDWGLVNNTTDVYETIGSVGYTGVSLAERVNYQGGMHEVHNVDIIERMGGTSNKSGYGAASVRHLLSSPWQAIGLLGPFLKVGIGVRNNIDAGTASPVVVSNIGVLRPRILDYRPDPASDEMLTYPCQGTTGVNYRLTDGGTNLVPGRDMQTHPLGHPIVIRSRSTYGDIRGTAINITSATMLEAATDHPVPLRPVEQRPSDLYIVGDAMQYILPNTPLSPNTMYRVTLNGTINSKPFTRTFAFTTGTGG